MARMHSRKKGISGSTKPITQTKKTWIKYKLAEVEKLVVKLAKQGHTQSVIGMILRDSYGIPDVRTITKKKIRQILEENKIEKKIPDDLTALIKKDIKLIKHRENHKHDITTKRGILLTESKINRLAKYYKKNKVLPDTWKYDRTKAKLLIE